MNGADMDLDQIKAVLQGADREFLDAVRRAAIDETERQDKVAQLPDQLAAMTRDAVAAGCDPETLRERVGDALTPEQVAELEA